jgi:iron complex outermembrane receptor protein
MKSDSARRVPLTLLLSAVVSIPATALAQEAGGTLDKVTIVAERTKSYRSDAATVGPLGERPLLDTPYSLDVVPAELGRNQQLKSIRELFRYLPSVQGENIRPQTRGLQAGVVQNTRIDGLNIAATTDYAVEQFDRIEVLNGLAGAIYGPANPAGTFNYVLKRPTLDPVRRFSVGYASRTSRLASVDVGDFLGESVGDSKRFGYRVNLLSDRGEGYVDRSRLERTLESLALDVNATGSTHLQLNASRYHYVGNGFPGTFALASNVRFPDPPDPKRVGYGQPFGGDDNVTKTFSTRLVQDLGANWHVSAGLLQQDSDRASTVPTNTLTSNAGAYRTTAATTTFSLDRIVSNTLAINGRVEAGGLTHDIVVSNTGFNWVRFTPNQTGAITLGTASLDNPVIFAEPVFPDFKSRFKALTTKQQSVTAGDTVSIGDQWSAGLFASQSWIRVRNTNKAGATTRRYDDDGISTNATVAYKPAGNMTIYGSYADSLQQGDIAPAGSANVGTALAPYRSKQWELGYKMGLSRLNFTADVFHVWRPYAVVGTDNVFRESGDQVNNGLELTLNGDVAEGLTVFTGVTYLDPTVSHTGVAATDGKRILGLSKVVGSVLVDYRIPAVPGLAVNLHVAHAGNRPGDNADSYRVDGFTTTDLSARYVMQMWGTVATWNVAVANLTDERYWANITPTGQNGYSGAGNGTGTIGAPRTVRASLQVEF